MHSNQRRRFVKATAGILLGGLVTPVFAATLTPRTTAGPFYPDLMPEDDDSDLTRVRGQDRVAQGEITRLTGRVMDSNGTPVVDARVEIWQCDINGRYRHSRENANREMDPGFQGFGHIRTGSDGEYGFTTIKPTHYPGRTPHIHFLVAIPDTGLLISQLYVEGESGNAGDFLYNSMSEAQQRAATTVFRPTGDGRLAADFDIVVGPGNLRSF